MAIRNKLAHWYDANRRDLPWRRTPDPYAIWISEIMLQQTRVAAVIPYYERFLARFPTPASLADAREEDVLAHWSGLGYYSRARNLQRAARQIISAGRFPSDYDSLLALAGVGEYTAAAVASIAFNLPHPVIDGNVKRVAARLTNNESNVVFMAEKLLDRSNPGRSNQAVMELGAMLCVPRDPHCSDCPVARHCRALRAGTVNQLPLKRVKPKIERRERKLLVIRRGGRILLTQGAYIKGLWDLPDFFSGVRLGAKLGTFRHSIMNSQYICEVYRAQGRAPRGSRWCDEKRLGEIALSTTAKKALRCLDG